MSKSQKFILGRIIISVILFVAGYAADSIWFFIAAYAISGYSTIIDAVMGIIHGQLLDENFLMTIASIGALYSGNYPEATAVMLLYLIGDFFEHYAVNSSRESIADLMNIQAEYANRITDGTEERVDPEDLEIGDIILIRPGEKVPVDGIVIEGSSSLDTAALTGESVPRDVAEGDEITSGTVCLNGAVKVRTTKEYDDSTVAKVLELVEDAAGRKSPMEKFITKFARYYTPMVVAAAVVLSIVPPLVTGDHDFAKWIYRAMIFLVVSCPCALVISVPLSFFAGVGSASRQGILVKGSNYLEALANVDTFAFDKTGTLTSGAFQVTDIHPASEMTEDMLLEICAHGESLSNHPIATCISQKYGNVDSSRISDYHEIPGKGVKALLDGKEIYCGNERLVNELGLTAEKPEHAGSTVHIIYDGKYTGYITVSDAIRSETKETISGLRRLGVKRTVMLTGDRKEIAEQTAKEIGITDVLSELLPKDKVTAVEGLMSEEKDKKNLAFVGDGINDAPVLSRADVGIAMGAFGSDAAIEAADVVILTDDLSKLVACTKIARKTVRICKQNVVFALVIKFSIMILGVFGLASMWAAVFSDVGVAFVAILNAMRALKFK